jgi:hypothetical protein
MKLRPLTVACVLASFAIATAGATAKPDKPTRHRVDVTGETKMVGGSIVPGPAKDHGTITGKPFGDAKIKLKVQLDVPSQTATGTFRIRNDRGTALGTVDMKFEITPESEVDFTGTADFTGGKGLYKGIRGTDLKAHDHNTLDGQNGQISLKGFATY